MVRPAQNNKISHRGYIMNAPQRKTIAAAIALALAAGSAHAVLERVGPNSTLPSQGGYPTWYQDTTGLALEFCDPKNVAEVEGGWCLLLPSDVPTVPEVFPVPGMFFDEHFFYEAGANMVAANGSTAVLVLAVEAAFAADVAPGGQMTFSRIRVRLNSVPMSGTYRFIHPYGEEVIEATQGERIFFTDDVGISCPPGIFDCALSSRLGPFLLPSDTPGGAELPAVTGPVQGKLYIADPGRLGPVTGSELPEFEDSTKTMRNHNIFRIEGPVGSNLGGLGIDWIETTNFSLMGRVFTSTMSGRIDVQRANYALDSLGGKLDVFALAFPTAQPRLPSQPRPPFIDPQLTFFDAPCAGVDSNGTVLPPFSAPPGANEVQMFSSGGKNWGQIKPAVMPRSVCVKDGSARDATGRLVPTFAKQLVTDDVTVSEAIFDPSKGELSVSASSSDTISPPTLSLAFDKFLGEMENGKIVVTGLVAPPSKVQVLSSHAGLGEYKVQVMDAGNGSTPPNVPVALNDSWTFNEGPDSQPLDVLNNDSNAVGATITIISPPRLGTAEVVSGKVIYTPTYTPTFHAYGGDAFTYTATVGTLVSNAANVTLNIKPVNDVPIAVNDIVSAFLNVPLAINVLANDTDLDGIGDIVEAVNLTQPVLAGEISPAAGTSVTVAGGVVTFTSNTPGIYTFTYQAKDMAGATSSVPATVTVTVAAAETLNFVRAEYVTGKNRLRAEGTINPAANQAIKVEFLNTGGNVLGLAGTPIADAAGNWALDTVVALPNGATALKATPPNGGDAKSLTLRIKK
jgi:hypothetical protein